MAEPDWLIEVKLPVSGSWMFIEKERFLHLRSRRLLEELEFLRSALAESEKEEESRSRKHLEELEFLRSTLADEDPDKEEEEESRSRKHLEELEFLRSALAERKKEEESLDRSRKHLEELEFLRSALAESEKEKESRFMMFMERERFLHLRSRRRSNSSRFLPPPMAESEKEKESRSMMLSSSFEFLPPNMSELRVVLLGSSWSERSSVGNFILGETKFSTEEEPYNCLRVSGEINTKEIVLINTPDLLRPDIVEHKLSKHIENFSAPGPHVFLLVLQPEDFTEEQKLRLFEVLQSFSDQSFDHSLIVISTPRDESSGFMETYRQHPPLKDMIKKCKYRFLWHKDLELPELLTRLGQVVKENNAEHLKPR